MFFHDCFSNFDDVNPWKPFLTHHAMPVLTQREKEVIQLLSLGLTYKQIAIRIDVSHETVKMHVKNIYRKLKAQNKIEALQIVKLL